MKNSNKHNKPQMTTTFSIRLEQELLNQISEIAEEKKWSRNKAIVLLLEQQCKFYQEKLND